MTDAKTPGQALERRSTLLEKLAAKYMPNTPKGEVLAILNATAFKTKDGPPSNAQVAALLVVADQYNLNPWTREIFAFPDKQNGIVPVVGVDGWNRIANEHPEYQGETLELPPRDEWERIDEDAKLCPPSMRVLVYRKDREHPTDHTEYLDECYRPPFKSSNGHKVKGPWQSHTKRMLEHKARIQARRIAFGFAGIYDEDEAERIVEARYDVEGEAVEVELLGEDGWKQLLDAAAEIVGLSADDLLANAAALGHDGPGAEMPREIAVRLFHAMREQGGGPDDDEPDSAPQEAAARGEEGQDREEAADAATEPPGDEEEPEKPKAERSPSQMAREQAERAQTKEDARTINPKQVNLVYTQCTICGVDDADELHGWLADNLGVGSVKEIPASRLDDVIAFIRSARSAERGAA